MRRVLSFNKAFYFLSFVWKSSQKVLDSQQNINEPLQYIYIFLFNETLAESTLKYFFLNLNIIIGSFKGTLL